MCPSVFRSFVNAPIKYIYTRLINLPNLQFACGSRGFENRHAMYSTNRTKLLVASVCRYHVNINGISRLAAEQHFSIEFLVVLIARVSPTLPLNTVNEPLSDLIVSSHSRANFRECLRPPELPLYNELSERSRS